MYKIALTVGIDHYKGYPLRGCVADATRMHSLLTRHFDGTPNFECRRLISSEGAVTRPLLKKAADDLFRRDAEVALFYFAGHGLVNNLGGSLMTQDAARYDEGLNMTDLLTLANRSPAREKLIVLDCCHSGAFAQVPATGSEASVLNMGVTVLTACRETEFAEELSGGGLFTSLVCEALEGGAADIRGRVTTAGVYGYLDELLGGFEQRPLFKSHVATLTPLRLCAPVVPSEVLRLLPRYFPSSAFEYPLDPSYEPSAEPHHLENEEIFRHLQKLRDARLVVAVGEEHLFYAAMNRRSCKLTRLGSYYRDLAEKGRI